MGERTEVQVREVEAIVLRQRDLFVGSETVTVITRDGLTLKARDRLRIEHNPEGPSRVYFEEGVEK